jgi:hypothetical protein
MVFLGPRANAELVPKLHMELLASYATLAVVATLSFLSALIKLPLERSPSIINTEIPIVYSKVLAHNKVHFLMLYLLHLPTLYPLRNVSLYQKDEWALPGNLQSKKNKIKFLPSPNFNAVIIPSTHIV